MSSATFDSFDAMERNRDQSNALKATSLREAGGEELDECVFELALALPGPAGDQPAGGSTGPSPTLAALLSCVERRSR
ncbi:hypothetical protein J113_17840 [Mycobacterium tuberculosis CAS/NITR204]|uniref:Uncharacterized protein n=1 Tax=Mycobacterium tuberculosis CAS/NITR204 TaxID=1310114 RepID=R4MKL7_MYCTX|nr:hypothetical protein J113_17840 [Mycobacterium tuberculosis CAS/NITR204]